MLTSSIISTFIKRTPRLAAFICAFAALAEEQYEYYDWDDETDVVTASSENEKVAHHIMKYNKLSPVGLQRFPTSKYTIRAGEDSSSSNNINSQAILLRSNKLTEEEIARTARAIARCNSGTNNIPVASMTELGIPVSITPGTNANAVKELVSFLGSRCIVDGINHMKHLGKQGLTRDRVEKQSYVWWKRIEG